jgi:hypothetical protein
MASRKQHASLQADPRNGESADQVVKDPPSTGSVIHVAREKPDSTPGKGQSPAKIAFLFWGLPFIFFIVVYFLKNCLSK